MVESCSRPATEPQKLTARGPHRGAKLGADAFEVQSLAMRAIAEVEAFGLVAGLETGRVGTDSNRHGLEAFRIGKGPTFASKSVSYVILKGNRGQHQQQAMICLDMHGKRKTQIQSLFGLKAV